jgi:hypothetical protein
MQRVESIIRIRQVIHGWLRNPGYACGSASHADACMSFSDSAAGVWFRRHKQAGQAV